MVAPISGPDIGETMVVSRSVCHLVGVSVLWLLALLAPGCNGEPALHESS
jgi:hypothetical protein